MRHDKASLLKEELRILAITTRERLELTQRKMAEKLEISESSYSDIETGRYMCSTLTAVLLLDMQEDINQCFLDLRVKFAEQFEKETQTV